MSSREGRSERCGHRANWTGSPLGLNFLKIRDAIVTAAGELKARDAPS
jgi:hypothetical protein